MLATQDTSSIPVTSAANAAAAAAPQKVSRPEAQKVAQQFEAIFVQQIVSKMRESADLLGESSMFGEGPGSGTYTQWFDTHMSEHLAASGKVGVADAILEHIEDAGQIQKAGDAFQTLKQSQGEIHNATNRQQHGLDQLV